ncbi:MAG: carbohydrate binding domain-containing protein [Candidatus Methanoperedens sp.]
MKDKILVFGLILIYMVVPIVEAQDELTMNLSLRPYSRILYVDYSFGDEKYSSTDKLISTAIETKSDTITFYPNFVDFLAIRYPGTYTCGTGACPRYNDSQLRYFINAAHKQNISVWLAVNPIEIKSTDAIKQWLQGGDEGKYAAVDRYGSFIGGSGYKGFEPAYQEPLSKRVEMYKWIFQNYDFQGLMYEEPVIAGISYGPNFDCAQRKIGTWTRTADPTPIQKWALLKCREEAYTEMYRQIHDNISSLGRNYSYPYFTITPGGVYTSYINGSTSGSNSMIYSSNLTDIYSKGYIDGHFAATIAPYSSTTNLRNEIGKVQFTFNNATTAGMMVAVVNTASDVKPCPNLYDMINIVDNSGAPYFIFHSKYLDVTATFQGSLKNNITRTCSGYSPGDTVPPLAESPRTWLSEHPPSQPRLFNPITGSSTLPVIPVVSRIVISPASSVEVGDGINFTENAKVYDQTNTEMSNVILDWSSSNTSVGTIGINNGSFLAKAIGTTTITAKNGSVSGTSSIVVTVPQPITNIINFVNNPDFESGTTSWIFYTNGVGTFSASSPGFNGTKTANLSLNNNGTNIQLFQAGVTLEPTTYYQLSFAAYSTSGHDLSVNLIKHISPYSNYGLAYTANLGPTWQTFTTRFNTTDLTGTVSDGRLQFLLSPFAEAGDTYYIDDIRLEKVIVSHDFRDLNNDSVVDINDLYIVFLHFNESLTLPRPNYDVNIDGIVDIYDMIILSNSI